MNIIKNTDSYKISHWKYYPEGLTEMSSYLESRGGAYDNIFFFADLRNLIGEISQTFSTTDIEEAEDFFLKHGEPFNASGWRKIKELGYLPIEIKAVKEGSIVPTKNVLLTIRNTHPDFAWLPSHLETPILRSWYPISVATRIHNMKKKIIPYYEMTGDLNNLPFSLLDFSSRGCSCLQESQLGGAAYLTQFMGSDNIPAVEYVNRTYGLDMSGFSIPATEHSIMTAYGQDRELDSFERIIEQSEPNSMVSVVSDSWDIFAAAHKWVSLKEKMIAKNLKLVFRPDSGAITEVLPEILKILHSGFGATRNNKGYDVLNGINVLWGDGINEHTVTDVFKIAKDMHISSDSVLSGSGGGLMRENMTRDLCKFAIKGSNVIINGENKVIGKNPITDKGKKSKLGRMILGKNESGEFTTYTNIANPNEYEVKQDYLETVYYNGLLSNLATFEEIRSSGL